MSMLLFVCRNYDFYFPRFSAGISTNLTLEMHLSWHAIYVCKLHGEVYLISNRCPAFFDFLFCLLFGIYSRVDKSLNALIQ